jgi:hypothetical protein
MKRSCRFWTSIVHQDAQSLDGSSNSEDGTLFDWSNPPYRQMSSLIVAQLGGNAQKNFAKLVRYLREAKKAALMK